MSIDQRYFRYLDHLGRTEPVRALVERPDATDLVALRHDVDHDLDLALEMAFWEHQRGCRASYYLLHSAGYWDDDRLGDKCLQLQDFGHEVGLHLNVVTEWVHGEIDDIDARLSELLGPLRDSGVEVVGVSAHGDRLCYEHGFANYWIFADLRPEDPITEEAGRSAEGVAVDDVRFQVPYPPNGTLERDDGAVLPLWTCSLADHNLRYHAYHAPSDFYLTDSGGSWVRSADPLALDVSRGRHQVLMHPIYYRGPQRYYLFLSAARSGSKWLSEVLDAGAAVTARHEFTLNHRYVDDEFLSEKHTGSGFRSLMHQPGELQQLVADARTWVEDSILGDWAEANVYLVHVLPLVEHYFRDAALVHFHRHPYDVVRSLLLRGWYETPYDDQHPVVDVEGWESLTQLEKICHYVRRVNEQLLDWGLPRVALEDIASAAEKFQFRLAELGVAVYPRLLATVHGRVLNASQEATPPLNGWPATDRRTLQRICGPIAARLGYRREINLRSRVSGRIQYRAKVIHRPKCSGYELTSRAPRQLLSLGGLCDGEGALDVSGGRIETVNNKELTVHPDGERHTWIRLGRATEPGNGPEPITTTPNSYIAGGMSLQVEGGEEITAAVFAFMFGVAGHPRGRRRLCSFDPRRTTGSFSFRLPPNCHALTLAVYVPLTPGLRFIRVRELYMEEISKSFSNQDE